MGLPQIGLEAIYKDAGFQRGIEQFNSGISKATTNAERGASAISRIGSIASGALTVGIGAAVTAFGALTAASKIGLDATLQWGEGLDKLGDMFGLSGEKASAFQYLANKVGLSVDEMGFGLNTLTRGLQDSADAMKDPKAKATPFMQALQKLGISAINSKGKLKSFDEILPQIMDAFKKLPPSINKSDLAMTLFGARGGSKFLDFLSAGSEGLTDATKKVKELGLELNTTQVNAIEDFGFAMNEVKLNLTGLWNTIGIQVLPIARQFVDFINTRILPALVQWARENMPKLIKAFTDLWKVLEQNVFPILEQVSFIFQDVLGMFTDFSKPVGDASNQLEAFAADVASLANSLGLGGFDIEGAILGVANAISKISEAFKTGGLAGGLGELGAQLGNAFKNVDWNKVLTGLDTLKTKFWNWLTGTGGVLEKAATELGKVKDRIVKWVEDNGPATWDLIKNWAGNFWNWITDSKEGLLVTVATNMGNLASKLESWATDKETVARFQKIGEDLASDILTGIGNFFLNPTPSGENVLLILWATFDRARKSVAVFFASLGGAIAGGVIGGIVGFFFGEEAKRRVTGALTTYFTDLQKIILGPGGPVFGFGWALAGVAWDGVVANWKRLFGSWNPFASNPTIVSKGNAGAWGGTGEKFADGGPVTRTGMAFVHAGEFVLNRAQVMQLAPVLAGANNSRVYNFNHTWPASVPASDRQWTEQMVRTVTHQEIINVLGNA